MPHEELRSWCEYDHRELLPDRRNEQQLATIAHILCCTNSRNPSAYSVDDFMPSAQREEMTPDQVIMAVQHG